MTNPPDWVTEVPASPAVHNMPAGYQWQGMTQEQLADLRGNLIENIVSAVMETILGFFPFGGPALELLGVFFDDLLGLLGNPLGLGTGNPSGGLCGVLTGTPFGGGLAELGGDPANPMVSIINGVQVLADTVCGLATGTRSIGATTPQSMAAGITEVADTAMASPFTQGILALGRANGTSGNRLADAISGAQSFADQLFNIFGLCGCSSPPGVVGPDLLTPDMVEGNPEWCWDFPGPEGSTVASQGCVRTKRNGLLTVYYVGGTWEQAEGSGGQGVVDPQALLDALNDGNLDWTRVEWVNIPYPGTNQFVQDSIDEGAASVAAQINLTPGKFVLAGGSQGANVISQVYDELRSGSLTGRNSDLVLGVAMSNPRRQQGRGWPGGPVYCTSGRGLVEPNLTGTETRWWEWSVSAGTYPANDSTTGVTYQYGDIAGCCPDTPAGDAAREAYAIALAGSPTAAQQSTYRSAYQAINNGTGPAHSQSPMVVQPLLSEGDHRTFLQIVMDQVDTLSGSVTPPAATRRELPVGDPVAVTPGQVVTAAARAQWINVACSGPAILVKVRVYDSGDQVITDVTDVNATISNPAAQSTYQTLSGEFIMPAGAATAQMVLDVEADAMESGTVWFADAVFGDMDPQSATPQSVLASTQQMADALASNPFAAGMLSLGQANGSSGNVAVDLLGGVQSFVDLLCGTATGQESPGSSPTTLLDGVGAAVGAVTEGASSSPFAAGILGMGGSTGNLVADAFTGLQSFVDSLCGAATGQTSTNTTPSTMLGGFGAVNQSVDNSAFASGVLDLASPSGNRGVDAINGIQVLFGALCGLATGDTDITSTTPTSMLSTMQGMSTDTHLLLSGVTKSDATAVDLLEAAKQAVDRNSATHVGHQAATPATAVSLKAQNLLVAQDFSNSYTLAAQAHWSWDSDGDATPGCALCTCDGTQDELLSSEIPVVAGATVEVACVVKWANLTYTGSDPIILGVQKYRRMAAPNGAGTVYMDVGHHDVDTISSPGASSGGWQDLAGTYVVQSGVDQLRFRLKAAKTVTSGTVKFDNCVFLRLDLIDDAAVPGVGTTVDSIVTELYGAQGTGFSHNDAAVALANTAAALVSVTARVAALEAEGGTGAIAADDFLYSGELVSTADWAGSYSNNMGRFNANGTLASFDEDPAYPAILGACTAKLDWTGTDNVSDTDYQMVQAVLASSPEYNATMSKVAHTTLYGRVSADWQSYIVLDVGGDGTYSVSHAVAGVETVMNSGTCTVPGMGALMTMWCGVKASAEPRRFIAKINTTTLCDFTEVGTASQYGVNNRKWGQGGTLQHFSAATPAISYDSYGPGDAGTLASGTPDFTWSHTCAAGAYLLVALVRDNVPSRDIGSVTYGAQSLSLVSRRSLYGNPTYGTLELWELFGAAGGAHTVTVATVGTGVSQQACAASTSYRNVATSSGKAGVDGRGNSLSQAAACSAGQWVAQVFGANYSGDIYWSAATGGTRRVHQTGNYVGVSMGDAAVGTTFTEKSYPTNALSNYWAGISLVMSPAEVVVPPPGPYVYPARIDQWIGMDQ